MTNTDKIYIVGNFKKFNEIDHPGQAKLNENGIITTNGSSLWSKPANWLNGKVLTLINDGMEVVVNPGGDGILILDIEVMVNNGGILTIAPGKQLIINGNLIQQ